jgi:DNA polymerase III epsilon subunit-like protein
MYHPELFISVDIETDGPIPGPYSMLATGAVVVDGIFKTEFYAEMKPISTKFDPEALAVSGLDRKRLIKEGADPKQAMGQFDRWVSQVCAPTNAKPVFVGFAAPFDWIFNHWYFVNFLGRDPFGFTGLDIKAYYMGARKVPRWSDTSKSKLPDEFKFDLGHNALEDAREQAKSFWRMLQANRS